VKLENTFEVPAPPEAAWALLMDVPRIVPCMPGAQLTETIDDETWKALMSVKLGPISLSFDTEIRRELSDENAREARLSASAREKRGRGAAQAKIESRLAPIDGGTRIEITTDLALSGPVAQYGRGMIEDVSTQLVKSFADCLQAQLVAQPEEARAAVAAQAKPVKLGRHGFAAFLHAIGRFARRITGRDRERRTA
jgi:carbon monoxide dehydrogenase subunit G